MRAQRSRKGTPKKRRTATDPAAELERKYASDVVFIDPKGKPYSPREAISVGGSTFNEPEGVRCYTHECFAASWLESRGEEPSEQAWNAASETGFDFGPYESELILRGWTRGRGCYFTVRERNKDSLWNVALASRARGCRRVVTERLDSRGLVDAEEHFQESLEKAAEWAGLRRNGKR
jgi:hypothetical protein